MEAVVLDVVGRVLFGVDHHVLCGRVQHVAHPNVLQVGDVADRLTVANDDSIENLQPESIAKKLNLTRISQSFKHELLLGTLSQSTRRERLSSKSVADLKPKREIHDFIRCIHSIIHGKYLTKK